MDDAKQRTDALKKAFADVILNLTKETAARVLAAEKKAARFQQDLVACKDEALKTLLRVKCVMDGKVNEKERVSLDQARRIQELEVQLEEAKKTINCLETDLERMNNENVVLKNNAAQTRKKEESASVRTQFEGPKSDDKSMHIFGPVLYSPSYESGSVSYKKISASPCHQTVTRKSRSLNYSKIELNNVKPIKPNNSDAIVLANINYFKDPNELCRPSTGRRAKRRSMRKARLLTSIKGHLNFEPCSIPPDLSNHSSQKVSDFSSPPLVEDPELGYEDCLQLRLLDKPVNPAGKVDGPGVSTENVGLKDTSRLSGSVIQDSFCDANASRVNFSNSNDHSSPEGKSISPIAKSNGVEASQAYVNLKQEELPLVNSDVVSRDVCKSAEVGTSLGSGDRFLKYTFRRKRIRGSSNNASETTDPEKNNSSNKRTCLNDDFAPEPSKPLAGRQTSSDSRRIAQVARQLISLSQKRWG